MRAPFRLIFAVTFASPAVALSSECDNPDPKWLMCEDFEKANLGWDAWYSQSPFVECNGCNGTTNDPTRIQLDLNPADAYAGSGSLYMPAAAPNYEGASLTFRTCTGTKQQGCVLTGYEQMY